MHNTPHQLVVGSYDTVRNFINDGDVIFVRGAPNSIVQRIIMFFTRSVYSHVGIAFWITVSANDKRLMIVEAQGGTARRILNLSYYMDRKFDVIQAPIAWPQISNKALEDLGQIEYSFSDAIYIRIREYLKPYGIHLPRTSFSGEICSEFVARLLNITTPELSPQSLFKELRKSGYKIKAKVV